MPEPPFPVPRTINVGSVGLGAFGTADGGAPFTFTGQATAHIEGDTNGVFTIVSLETLAIRRDPDEPPGSPGSWQTLASVEGAGPIAMARSGAIVITVRFACPTAPTHDQYTAKAVIVGTSVQAPLVASVNISATVDRVGSIRIVTVPTTTTMTGILAGTTGPLNFQLVSTLHTGARVSAQITSGEPFSSPVNVSDVQVGATVDVSLPITCAARTSAGPSDVTTTFTRLDDNSLISSITQRLMIIGDRAISVTVDQPQAVTMAPGTSLACKVIGSESGGTSPFTFTPRPMPPGVTLSPSLQETAIGGTGGTTYRPSLTCSSNSTTERRPVRFQRRS